MINSFTKPDKVNLEMCLSKHTFLYISLLQNIFARFWRFMIWHGNAWLDIHKSRVECILFKAFLRNTWRYVVNNRLKFFPGGIKAWRKYWTCKNRSVTACSKVYFDIKRFEKQTTSHEFVHTCLRLKKNAEIMFYVCYSGL